MMMKSILFILPILSVTFAATLQIQYTTKYRSPEERRKLGLFPKTSKKFVITENPTESGVGFDSVENKHKRILMPKLVIKNKNTESTKYTYKEPLTRRPLMKYKKFNLEPTSTQKISYANFKNAIRITHEESFENSEENENDYLEGDDNYSSEADKSSEKLKGAEKSVEVDNIATETESTAVLEFENNKFKRHNVTAIEIITNHNTSGEKEDLKEFIFGKNIVPRSINEEEFTTDSSPLDIVKRAVNVIEEENLVTTVSVFKFTGRQTYLTNELNYKNIHS